MLTKNKNKNKNGIIYLLIAYWVVLVAWQNISNATARTGFDTFLKAGLLVAFCIFFLNASKLKLNLNIVLIFFIAVSLLITFILNESITLYSIISYFYPIVFMICVYGLGGNLTINKKQLLIFLNCIIAVVLYMVIYALIFKTSQFTTALRLNTAYGHELSSFLTSNHEYGLYLSMAIISSIICYDLKYDKPLKQKWFYIVVICLFLINLLLTFSRTSMLGAGIALIIYCIFGKKSFLKNILLILGLIAIVLIFTVSDLRDFFFKIVLKDGNLAGRDDLTDLAIYKFNNANVLQKLFGYGDTDIRLFFTNKLAHSSIHNAYLQILLSYGLIPLICLIVFLIYNIFYCFKLCKYNKFIGVLFLAIVLFGIAIMFTNTTILFMSPIDSYFLTIFVVVLPKYVGNTIIKKEFD